MSLCGLFGHKWGRWRNIEVEWVGKKGRSQGSSTEQQKECQRCGKRKWGWEW